MTASHDHPTRSSTGFGFEEIMAEARFDRFPAWWAARRLPPNNPFAVARPPEASDVSAVAEPLRTAA